MTDGSADAEAGARPRIILLTDPAMATHAAPGHPERPERLDAVAAGIRGAAAAFGGALEEPTVSAADDAVLTRVHAPWYVAAVSDATKRGGGWIDADTYLAGGSMEAARLSAGAAVQAARAVASGEATVAFSVGRPPGHHASTERAAGFCIFNNVAIAAAALRAEELAHRIAIVDWDVHHGDGTQAIFDADADLWYGSTHQSPLYPGTGAPAERGIGPAIGTKHNRPLPPGSGDEAFVGAWREELLPTLMDFRPEAVLVSAGYDAHRSDLLANLEVTEAGFEEVARAVGDAAQRLGRTGVALVLEGGYDLAALRASAAATVRGLLDGTGGIEAGS
jgi:acetoin utilization deacetylase AcuC-like enzyme